MMFPFYWFCNYWKIIIKIKESIYEWINTVSQEWKALGTLTKKNNSLSLLKKKIPTRMGVFYSHTKTVPLACFNYLFLKKGFLTKKFLPISMVSDAARPIVRNKYINWFLNLHELEHIILTHMIYWPNVTFIKRSPLEVSCSNKTHTNIFLDVKTILEQHIRTITRAISSTIKV